LSHQVRTTPGKRLDPCLKRSLRYLFLDNDVRWRWFDKQVIDTESIGQVGSVASILNFNINRAEVVGGESAEKAVIVFTGYAALAASNLRSISWNTAPPCSRTMLSNSLQSRH
jgi:hypothetical protein